MTRNTNAWFISVGCAVGSWLTMMPEGTPWSHLLNTPQKAGALMLAVLGVFNAGKAIKGAANEREHDNDLSE